MKKVSFLLSMFLIAAFVLAACGPADDTDATPGVDVTPGVGDVVTQEPTLDTMPVEPTPVVEETLPTEAPVVETPVVDMTEEPTEQAGVPVTGENQCRAYTVQGLLDMDVFDAQGNQIGDVDGVIVLRDANAAMVTDADVDAADMQATVDPMATPAAVDATPVVTDDVTGGAASANFDGAAPQLAYVVIDLENEDDEIVVPFTAFDVNASADFRANEVDGVMDPVNTPDPMSTPVAGENTADDGRFMSDCFITLNNVQADALGELPRFDDDIDLTVDNWDADYRSYWSNQGLSIPATGESNLGAAVLLNDEWDAVDAENVNGDDLGEVEDFLYTQDGQFDYAVLTAGGFLGIGERVIPVPMSMVQWISRGTDNDIDDVGQVIINVTDEDWENAPSFDSFDEIDNSVAGWDDDIRAFWNNLTTPNQ